MLKEKKKVDMTIKDMEKICEVLLNCDEELYEKILSRISSLDIYTQKNLKRMLLTFYILRAEFMDVALRLNKLFTVYADFGEFCKYLRVLCKQMNPEHKDIWYIMGAPKHQIDISFLKEKHPDIFLDDYTALVFFSKHKEVVSKYRQHLTTTQTISTSKQAIKEIQLLISTLQYFSQEVRKDATAVLREAVKD